MLRPLNIIIRGLNQLQQNIFHILSHVAGLGQRGRVRNSERYIQHAGKRLRQQRLSGSGRPQHKNIALLQLHIAFFSRENSFIVIIDRNRQNLFRFLLPDHILIQKLLDLHRLHEVNLPAARYAFLSEFLINNFRADSHAVVTDISSSGPVNQFFYLVLAFSTKGAVKLHIISLVCHSSPYFKHGTFSVP